MARIIATIASAALALAFSAADHAAPGAGGGGKQREGGGGGSGMQQRDGKHEQRHGPGAHQQDHESHDDRGVGRPGDSARGEGRKVQRRPTREDDGFGRPIFGGELMSADERERFRLQMRNAEGEGERERLRNEHRGMILQRARERGESLSD